MSQTGLPDFVEITNGLPDALRSKLGLQSGEKLRLCYLSLANDVARVQQFWAKGQGDPRSQKATYAGMFFELVEKLNGEGLLVSHFDTEPPPDQAVRIAKVDRQLDGGTAGAIVDQVFAHVDRFQPHLVVISPSISTEIIPLLSQICPTVYYAHSVFWPLDWDHSGASLKARARRFFRRRRNRKNLSEISGVLASSDIALRQTQRVIGDQLPFEVTRNQFAFEPRRLSPRSARNILFVGEYEASTGVEMVVDAFRMLKQDAPDATLTMIGVGGKSHDLEALGELIEGVTVHVGFDAEKIQNALQSAGLLVVADDYWAMKALPTYLPEALISGVPALVSTSTPANPAELAHCATFKAGDIGDLQRQLKRLVSDAQAYQALCDKLPMDHALYYDRSRSWGSGIARLFAKIYGVS